MSRKQPRRPRPVYANPVEMAMRGVPLAIARARVNPGAWPCVVHATSLGSTMVEGL